MAKRSAPEVNAGSMADIAFLLLIFFLVTTTIETDSGLNRKLPPLEDQVDPPITREKNIFTVLVSKNDQLLVEEKLADIEDLRSLNSKLADFSVDIQKTLIDLTFTTYGFHGFDLPDPITMAIALDNSIIEDSEQLHVIVDTRDGITRGQTIVDYFNVEEKNQNIRVVTKSDKDKFMNLLTKSLK